MRIILKVRNFPSPREQHVMKKQQLRSRTLLPICDIWNSPGFHFQRQATAQSLSPKQHTKPELAWIKDQTHNAPGSQKSTTIWILERSCLVAKAEENFFQFYSIPKCHIPKKSENKILVLFFCYTNMVFFT